MKYKDPWELGEERIDAIGQNGGTGDHYVVRPTYYGDNDPFRYSIDNNLGVLEHTAIKYITRHCLKNGAEDIDKAINTLLRLKDEYYGKGKTPKT